MITQSLQVMSLMDELQRLLTTQVPDLTVLDSYAKETESARSSHYGEPLAKSPVLTSIAAAGSQGSGGHHQSADLFMFQQLFRTHSDNSNNGGYNSTKGAFESSPPPQSDLPGKETMNGSLAQSQEASSSGLSSSSSSNAAPSGKTLMRRTTLTSHKVLDELEAVEEDDSTNMETFCFGDFVMSSNTVDESPVARVKPKSENAFMFGDFFVDDVPLDQFRTSPSTKKTGQVLPGGGPPSPITASAKHKLVSRPKISEGSNIGNFHLHHYRGHPSRIKGCVIASQRENCIVSSSDKDSYPRLMAEKGNHPLSLYLGHHNEILHVSVSIDCSLIGTSSVDGFLIIFEISTGIKSGDAKHPCPVRCSSFSKNGKFIVSGAEDGNCRLWASKKKAQNTAMCSYFRQKGNITCISFQPTGELIASGSSDTSVHVWSGSTGKMSFMVQEKHLGAVTTVSFNANGDQLLSADNSRAVISDCVSGSPIYVVDADAMRAPGVASRLFFSAVAFSPIGCPNYILFCGSDRRVSMHELVPKPDLTSPITGKDNKQQTKTPTGHKLRAPMLALSPEVLSFTSKSPIVCVSPGPHRAVALGDVVGNVAVLVLDARPGEKEPPLALYKQAKLVAAKRKEKPKTI